MIVALTSLIVGAGFVGASKYPRFTDLVTFGDSYTDEGRRKQSFCSNACTGNIYLTTFVRTSGLLPVSQRNCATSSYILPSREYIRFNVAFEALTLLYYQENHTTDGSYIWARTVADITGATVCYFLATYQSKTPPFIYTR